MWFHWKPLDINPFNINLWNWIVYDFDDEEEVEETQEDWTIKKVKKTKDFIDLDPF